jgi:hypothetical protein
VAAILAPPTILLLSHQGLINVALRWHTRAAGKADLQVALDKCLDEADIDRQTASHRNNVQLGKSLVTTAQMSGYSAQPSRQQPT